MAFFPFDQKRRGDSGFSLLEVLVAAALMAGLAAILLQVMTVGLRAQKANLEQAQALEVAGQIIQEYSREALLQPGTFQGRQGAYIYQVRIAPQYQVAAGHTQVICYLVTVAVSWPERGASKSVELSTMRTVLRRMG
jgi:prepilin-type N-terminal cleavage/methylation domain-containing protein|uniref:Prepilin-type N-terminal cleavage/methylation domain-containing protein n=1 Tax=Desulfobacca acetoxidans TaxID=60893 RepID=A0A7C3SIV3_9BACT